ncbi:MAG: Aspartate aminotransferase, partial [Pseudomonadota bacterium]
MIRPHHRLASVETPIIPTIAALVRNNPGTISLGQGVVNYGPPAEAIASLPGMMGDGSLHKYLGVSGHPGLVEAIQTKLAQENQVKLGSDAMLMVTAG